MKNGVLPSFKVLLITKRKGVTLRRRNLVDNHLNLTIEVNIVSNGTNRNHVPPDRVQ